MKDGVSIIIPVLNESYLPKLIENLYFHLSNNYEVIVIDSDKSKTKISLPEMTNSFSSTIPYPKIFTSYADSLERAILLGFSVAKEDKIIVMDADGSHPPQLVPKLTKELDTHEMVVASRFIEGGKYNTSLFRAFVTFVFNSYAGLLGSTLTDSMSGFFGIQSQLLTKIKFKPYTWKIALEINNKLRPKTKEISYTFQNRKNGKSKSNWKVGLKILWDITAGAL